MVEGKDCRKRHQHNAHSDEEEIGLVRDGRLNPGVTGEYALREGYSRGILGGVCIYRQTLITYCDNPLLNSM